MYEFLDRLINIALPRIRDFRGVSGRSFDGRGNYNIGVKEQIIFPEIDFDQVDAIRGMDIAITTTAQDRRRSQGAARSLQLPVPQLTGQDYTMAKTSMVNREIKRAKLVKQYAAKRATLKEIDLQPDRVVRREDGSGGRSCRSCRAIPSPARQRNRCAMTGRSRGVYRKFGLGRNKLREATMRGDVPGLRKASW